MIITRNNLTGYCQKVINAQMQYNKLLQEQEEQYKKDFEYAGQQYANVKKKETTPIVQAAKLNITKEADKLINTLKEVNKSHIESLYKKGQTKEYKETLSKFMTLSGGKINSKIIKFMSENYDLEGLEFLYDDDLKSKNNSLIREELETLKRGFEPLNTIVSLLEFSKERGMFESGIKTLIDKLPEISQGLVDIKAFTDEEYCNYVKGVAAGTVEADEVSDIRKNLYKQENGFGGNE